MSRKKERTSFIVGFPEERLGSLTRTVEAVLRAQEAGAADAPVQLLRAYPGSPLHRQQAGALELEPLLCTTSDDDAAALALITAHPDLLSASYRVPGALPRKQVMAAWVCLSALREVLAALWRNGVDPGAVLGPADGGQHPGRATSPVPRGGAGGLRGGGAGPGGRWGAGAGREKQRTGCHPGFRKLTSLPSPRA